MSVASNLSAPVANELSGMNDHLLGGHSYRTTHLLLVRTGYLLLTTSCRTSCLDIFLHYYPQQVLHFRLDTAMGIRAIGRVLNINFVTIYYWIRKFGESIEFKDYPDVPGVVELDEIHSYVGRKKLLLELDRR